MRQYHIIQTEGLTRGFLFAGARSVISSLWKVDDIATEKIMVNLYRNIEKISVKNGLIKAQRSVKRHYPPPYDWSEIQITGS